MMTVLMFITRAGSLAIPCQSCFVVVLRTTVTSNLDVRLNEVLIANLPKCVLMIELSNFVKTSFEILQFCCCSFENVDPVPV